MKKCKFCQEPFSGFDARNRPREFCSVKCGARYTASFKKVDRTKTCPYCNTSYIASKSIQIYCDRACQSSDLAKRGISCKKPRDGSFLNCKICNKQFYVQKYRIKGGKATYCSRSCLAKDLLIPQRVPFKRSKELPHEYRTIKVNGKYIREHRHIMQIELGRNLECWEHVHHINGNGLDNRIENLQVLSNSEHQKLEYQIRNKD